MADPNEELVRRYFELQGYLVRTNLLYRVPRGWSDVDLVVAHPITGDAAAVEVKGWHMDNMTPGQLRSWPSVLNFVSREATKAVGEVLGRDDFRRVLVARFGGSRDLVAAELGARGVELLDFREVLRELIGGTSMDRNACSETEHIIRLLKTYGLLRS